MALVSLKQDEDYAVEYIRENFGYCTSITLNGEQTEAMGLKKMAAGQPVMIKAKGIVTRSTEEIEAAKDSGGKDLTITIQFTDMEVSAQGSANTARAAAILYGDDDD